MHRHPWCTSQLSRAAVEIRKFIAVRGRNDDNDGLVRPRRRGCQDMAARFPWRVERYRRSLDTQVARTRRFTTQETLFCFVNSGAHGRKLNFHLLAQSRHLSALDVADVTRPREETPQMWNASGVIGLLRSIAADSSRTVSLSIVVPLPSSS